MRLSGFRPKTALETDEQLAIASCSRRRSYVRFTHYRALVRQGWLGQSRASLSGAAIKVKHICLNDKCAIFFCIFGAF